MRTLHALAAAIALFFCAAFADAGPITGGFIHRGNELERARSCISGQILDFTCNHEKDNRIFSNALGEKRDMYVYLPPNYDPRLQYPLAIYMHGFSQDERNFLDLAPLFDEAVRNGVCPPTVIVAPDGSLKGRPSLLYAGSFFVNSKAGRFEDYVMQDVWSFMHTRFSIRPEREAHALLGGSMGGFSAYNLGFKYRDAVRNLAGVFPPLNLRYLDCHGNYFGNFDPDCLGWRERLHPKAPVARYFGGLLTIRERRFVDPLFDRRAGNAVALIAAENPIEMLEPYDVRPGQFEMYIGYGGKDEFNIDAQVESFLHFARCRSLCVTVAYLPRGHHNVDTGKKFFPSMMIWLGQRLANHGPCAPPELKK